MRVTVLYFAAARERAGRSSEVLELPEGATVALALEAACAAHPALRPLLDKLRFAVDQSFSPASTALREGSELALIPPVSGGVELAAAAGCESPAAGAARGRA
jgi:MoaE-MoaD fusion protein